MANAWLAHVKATMKKHKGMKFKDVLRQAKKSYKSSKKVAKKSSRKAAKRSSSKRSSKAKKRRAGRK